MFLNFVAGVLLFPLVITQKVAGDIEKITTQKEDSKIIDMMIVIVGIILVIGELIIWVKHQKEKNVVQFALYSRTME